MADYIYYIRSDSPDDDGTGEDDVITGPTRAFRTWGGAEAALQGTIAAGDRVICEIRAGTYDEAFHIDGSTINGEWVWRALDGHQHLGVYGAGVVLQQGSNFTRTLEVDDPNVTFEDIEFRGNATGNGGHIAEVNLGATNTVVRRCIIGPNTSGNGRGIIFSAVECYIEASLAHDVVSASTYGIYISSSVAGNTFNCTSVNNNGDGWGKSSSGAAQGRVYNTVAYDSGKEDFAIPGTNVVGDFNASEDATAPGASSQQLIADPFTDFAGGDYTIADTDSALYDSGSPSNRPRVDSRGNANRSIQNIEFTTNDIGCYAFQGAVGDPADVNIPSKQIHVQGFAPQVEAPSSANIDLPSKQVHVQGFAPQVEAPSGADTNLPSKQIHVQAFTPQVEAPAQVISDLPSKQVHVQAFAPQVTVPSGADVDLPSKQVHVQAFAPSIDAPTDASIDLPSKQIHVQAFAPQIVTGAETTILLPYKQVHVQAFAPQVNAPSAVDVDLPSKQIHVQAFAPQVEVPTGAQVDLPSKQIHVQGFAPQVDAPTDAFIDLPSKQIHVQAFAPIVQTTADVFVNLPSKFIYVQPFAPTVDANQPIDVNLPSKSIHVVAFAPRIQAGIEEGLTLWESIEQIKMYIKPQIEALGLTQIMWPNIPIKRDSKIPFVQISIAQNDRELGDLGGVHRTIGTLVTSLHTPYGNDPGAHNKYVDGLMKMVSNTYLQGHILFLTSIPITFGRRDSWWVTNIETEFYLEGV